MQDKKTLRKELLQKRAQLMKEHPEISEQIAETLFPWLRAHSELHSLGLFSPIRSEPDLLAAAALWQKETGAELSLPVIENGVMRYCFWTPDMEMEEDRFHVAVPKEKREAHPDVILAPCVGFSREGFRLGYGGGWFDRTIPAMNPVPVTIGVASEEFDITDIFSPEEHDVKLSFLATEKGVFSTR